MQTAISERLTVLVGEGQGIESPVERDRWSRRVSAFLQAAMGADQAADFNNLVTPDSWEQHALRLGHLVLRKTRPNLLDVTDLIIVAVGLLPWLSSLIKRAELPGGLQIEFQDLAGTRDKVTGGSDLPPQTSPEGDRWARIEGRIENLIQDRVRSCSHDFSR